MKNPRILLLALTLAVTGALAQAPADETKAPKAAEGKKGAPPKKTDPVKKSDPAKKPEAKKTAPAKNPATANPNVRIYKAGDPNVPKLLDRDGKPIPTSPDAYDVSSATKK